MKRFFLLLSMLLLSLVACQNEAADVSFMVFGDAAELAAYENLVAAFTESQSDVTVTLTHIPSQGDYLSLIHIFVVTADPSGPIGLIGEFKAILSSMQSYVEAHAGDSSLMAALKDHMTNKPTEEEQEQIKQWAKQQEEQMKANRPKTPEELQQLVRQSVTGTIGLLRAKGADESEVGTFKAMICLLYTSRCV